MEVRCVKCRRLFFKVKCSGGVIEIKCPKCGHKQTITIAKNRSDPLSKENLDQSSPL